jgi:hypothetical protein
MEAAVSIWDHSHEHPSLVERFAHWWRGRSLRRRTLSELSCCAPAEAERIAQDVGVSRAELCILAGKWPDSLDLLSRRMQELRLDAAEVSRVEPQVIRDLQRTCSLCANKRRCRYDLADQWSHPRWQEYCPNATTLLALLKERIKSAGARTS